MGKQHTQTLILYEGKNGNQGKSFEGMLDTVEKTENMPTISFTLELFTDDPKF